MGGFILLEEEKEVLVGCVGSEVLESGWGSASEGAPFREAMVGCGWLRR